MRRYDFGCENEHVFEVQYEFGREFHRDTIFDCPECNAPATWRPSCNFDKGAASWWAGKQTSLGYFDSKEKYEEQLKRQEYTPWEPGMGDDAKRRRKEIETKQRADIKETVKSYIFSELKNGRPYA